MNRIFLVALAISCTIFAANGTLQNTVVNPDGSGSVSRRFPLTPDQVNAGALATCLSLRPSPIFVASIEISGTQTSCVHTAVFASIDELRQVYATVPGVSINQLTMQNGRFVHDINLTPPLSPTNLTTDLWQVQMPGAIIADNASDFR